MAGLETGQITFQKALATEMRHMRYLVYILVAVVLGVSWYAALLIPVVTRKILLGEQWLFFFTFAGIIAVVLATTFRKQLVLATSAERITLLAVALPILAAVLVMCGATVQEWFVEPGGPETLTAALSILAIISVGTMILFPLLTFYIVLPLGLFSAMVLRGIGKRLWPETVGQP